jgi:alkylhydroperoxidase family enzyme
MPMTAGATKLRPAAFAALDEAYAAAVAACPPGLLDLCGRRVRMLLGAPPGDGGDDPKTAALADYAASPLFSDLERSALEFTEQYVLDVAAMPDDLVEALSRQLGPAGLYGFVMGLYVVDQRERLRLSAAIHRGGRS